MKNKTNNISITTPRLQLELLSMKYIQEIFKEFTDEVTKTLRASTPKRIEEEEERVNKSEEKYKKWTDMNLVVTDTQGNFIWCCGVMHVNTNTPEIWLRIKQSERGKWYGKEMVWALIKRVETHKDVEYIVYKAHKDNIGTRKIVESFGWVLQLNEKGKEHVFMEPKFDNSSSSETVEYRIYKR